jgi:hypothetical protein
MYTLYNTSVELDIRLATVPQPVFHCNTLLASLAINSSPLLRLTELQLNLPATPQIPTTTRQLAELEL